MWPFARKPKQEPGPTRAEQRAKFCRRLNKLIALAGPERGVELAASGLSMEDILLQEVERLKGVIRIRDAQLDEINSRIFELENW